LGEIVVMNLISSADIRRLHLSPRRGKEKVARGKEAQRLPPWVSDPHQQVSFHGPEGLPFSPPDRGKREDIIYLITPDCASLVRGYLHVVPRGLQFGLLRSQVAERKR
jgi:hypothetical protein